MGTSSSGQKPTQGQLQRQLVQKVQKLYRDKLNHTPSDVTCQLLDDKLMVVIENSVTKPEQLLLQDGDPERAAQIREDLIAAIRPEMAKLVEDILNRDVVDILSDATLETGRTGLVIILSSAPDVRSTAKATSK
ncbi:MAG: DUF2294 domain-containing protein [Leptolyngbyaceae cyanobacterium SM2_5_2]|nr:DUF2294 domain-containing protein [Leptolyngbyaceae cyanobacterium SM2_5_2]